MTVGQRGVKHEPNTQLRAMVESMAAFGIANKDICTIMQITEKTLYKHYRHELDTGAPKAIFNVAQNLYKLATGEGPQAAVAARFYLQTRARWSTVEHVHVHGVPEIEDRVAQLASLSSLDTEDLVALERITKKLEQQREKASEVKQLGRTRNATLAIAAGDEVQPSRIASIN